MSAQDGGPAFPQLGFEVTDYATGQGRETQAGGMSLRQFAAIKLRVPNSGTDWLDDMILKANRDDFAGQALAGLLAGHYRNTTAYNLNEVSEEAFRIANCMLAARGGK